jgi:hypothetical protein
MLVCDDAGLPVAPIGKVAAVEALLAVPALTELCEVAADGAARAARKAAAAPGVMAGAPVAADEVPTDEGADIDGVGVLGAGIIAFIPAPVPAVVDAVGVAGCDETAADRSACWTNGLLNRLKKSDELMLYDVKERVWATPPRFCCVSLAWSGV